MAAQAQAQGQAQPLAAVLGDLAKANKNEVFLINLADEAFPTSTVAAKKDRAALDAGLAAALAGLGVVQKGGNFIDLHDWGGVIELADAAGRTALAAGEGDGKGDCGSTATTSLVFSFTPWNGKGKNELPRMAAFARR